MAQSSGTIQKEEWCYSIHGMYDVKPGVGKAYTGRRMMMAGYKKKVFITN